MRLPRGRQDLSSVGGYYASLVYVCYDCGFTIWHSDTRYTTCTQLLAFTADF